MTQYYVDCAPSRSTGRHLVHAIGCSFMTIKVVALGEHMHCHYALDHAREWYSDVDGCINCCPLCAEETLTRETVVELPDVVA